MFGSPSGRLMVYDPKLKSNKVLKEGIHFPNGMLLSPNEDYVIFAETLQYRLLRYWIKGPKTGIPDLSYNRLSSYFVLMVFLKL